MEGFGLRAGPGEELHATLVLLVVLLLALLLVLVPTLPALLCWVLMLQMLAASWKGPSSLSQRPPHHH